MMDLGRDKAHPLVQPPRVGIRIDDAEPDGVIAVYSRKIKDLLKQLPADSLTAPRGVHTNPFQQQLTRIAMLAHEQLEHAKFKETERPTKRADEWREAPAKQRLVVVLNSGEPDELILAQRSDHLVGVEQGWKDSYSTALVQNHREFAAKRAIVNPRGLLAQRVRQSQPDFDWLGRHLGVPFISRARD